MTAEHEADEHSWPSGAEGPGASRSARYLVDTVLRRPDLGAPLYDLDPNEPEAPPKEELEHLAAVYRCRPDQLLEAAGRQLRRVDGESEPRHQHLDVLALEVIARISYLSGLDIRDLPDIEESTVVLTAHVLHVKSCQHCMVTTEKFRNLFPSTEDFDAAEPLVLNEL